MMVYFPLEFPDDIIELFLTCLNINLFYLDFHGPILVSDS